MNRARLVEGRQRLDLSTQSVRPRLTLPEVASLRGSDMPRRLDVYTGDTAVDEVRFDKAWRKYLQIFGASYDAAKVIARRKLLLYLEDEMEKVKPGSHKVFTTDVRFVVDLLFGSRELFCSILEAYDDVTGAKKV